MGPTGLPPLNAVRAFEAVASAGSVSAAARVLCVSQSSVSRHLALLEDALGCRLVERSPTGIRLTDDGEEFRRAVDPALARLREATRRLRARTAGVRTVRVSSLSSFALRWLTPRLPAFHLASGGVPMDLRVADGVPSFEDGLLDAAIVCTEDRAAAPSDVRLMDETLAVVCAPGRADVEQSIVAPAALLATAPQIHVSTRAELWPRWIVAHGIDPAPDAGPGFAFQDFYVAIAAAVSGAGFALVPDFLVEDELARGTLVEPFGDRLPTGRSYRLRLADAGHARPEVLAFRDWLQDELQASPQRLVPTESDDTVSP